MEQKKTILIKLSGELFSAKKELINAITSNIKELLAFCKIGVVVGGGNFFKGSREGKELGLKESTGHIIGMLATIMNGLTLQELLDNVGVKTELFSAMQCDQVAKAISPGAIKSALAENKCLIFAGGTGNPFFTTDTNSVLRALQIDASEVWKATNVDGVYDMDPNENKNAKLLKQLRHQEAIEKNLRIMDLTAMTLAKEHSMKIRVFNMLKENALLEAYKNPDFGSTVK